MKRNTSKYYTGGVVVSLAIIIAVGCYYTLTTFSQKDDTHYLYIDRDDTAD